MPKKPPKPTIKITPEPVASRRVIFESFNRKWVYGGLGILVLIVIGLFLCVPHYKTLHVASAQQEADARHDIISQYFLRSTTCIRDDNLSHTARIQAFNEYFKVNKYANRAVIRGCNDNDALLAKADNSNVWERTDVNITLNTRQNPIWQKACLIDDITTADTVVRPENSSIDAGNLAICNTLRKQSYVAIHFDFTIHFHK